MTTDDAPAVAPSIPFGEGPSGGFDADAADVVEGDDPMSTQFEAPLSSYGPVAPW